MDKLRAVVSAGELLHELNDMVARRIAQAGKSLAEVLPTAEVALAFTDAHAVYLRGDLDEDSLLQERRQQVVDQRCV